MHFGFNVQAVKGKAAIIRGPLTQCGGKPVGVEQLFHVWLNIQDVGTCDVSANLTGIRQLGSNYSSFAGIIASKVLPQGLAAYYLTRSESKYNAMFDAATNIDNGLSLIYLAKDVEPMDSHHLDSAFQWCNSPLTCRLKNLKIPKTAYRKAVEHMVRLLDNDSVSIAGMPQMAAWKKLVVD